MKSISELIDPCTRIVRTVTNLSSTESCYSGYLAFCVNSKVVQRRIYSMPYNVDFNCSTFIKYNNVRYAIDKAAKPLSGAFNAESLRCMA